MIVRYSSVASLLVSHREPQNEPKAQSAAQDLFAANPGYCVFEASLSRFSRIIASARAGTTSQTTCSTISFVTPAKLRVNLRGRLNNALSRDWWRRLSRTADVSNSLGHHLQCQLGMAAVHLRSRSADICVYQHWTAICHGARRPACTKHTSAQRVDQ